MIDSGVMRRLEPPIRDSFQRVSKAADQLVFYGRFWRRVALAEAFIIALMWLL